MRPPGGGPSPAEERLAPDSETGLPRHGTTMTADPPADPATREEPDEERGGLLAFFRELPGLVLVAFALALIIKTFLVQAFFIPSASMVPTLEVGDRVLVNKLVYDFGEPQRFDVIVFEDPNVPEPDRGFFGGVWHWLTEGLGFATAQEQDYIKRVIGLPGEEIEGRDGKILINGKPLHQPPGVHPDTQSFGPVTIEPDKVFVMGDNRDRSQDSRLGLGAVGGVRSVPFGHIKGKAMIIWWSSGQPEGIRVGRMGHLVE